MKKTYDINESYTIILLIIIIMIISQDDNKIFNPSFSPHDLNISLIKMIISDKENNPIRNKRLLKNYSIPQFEKSVTSRSNCRSNFCILLA
jgi:hypothetical protein